MTTVGGKRRKKTNRSETPNFLVSNTRICFRCYATARQSLLNFRRRCLLLLLHAAKLFKNTFRRDLKFARTTRYYIYI